jgi:ribosomal protein L40E
MDMDQERYKVCPECAGEYRPEIERCADCDVPLVGPEEITARDARELPLTRGLVALRTAPIAWVRALAQDLAGQAIPYGIDRGAARSEGLLTLYVRRQDLEEAAAVDAARRRIEDPLGEEEEEEAGEEPANVVPIRAEEPSYKVCPRCGGEYRLDAERCADCGVELVFPDAAPAVAARLDLPQEEAEDDLPFAGPLHELPPSDDEVCVCCRSTRALLHLSRELDTAEIAHRVEVASHGSSVNMGAGGSAGTSITFFGCLYVLPAHGDAAAAIDAELFGGVSVEAAAAELTVCPACGTPRPPGALECSECGLVLGSDTEAVGLDPICPRCGAVVGTGGAHCPNCGAGLPRA